MCICPASAISGELIRNQSTAPARLTIGFKDIMPFAEIEVRDLEKLHGLEVCIATTAKNEKEGLELFRLLKFPLRKE